MSVDLAAYGLVSLSEMEGEFAHAARGIPLRTRGGSIRAFTVVDAVDFAAASAHRWCLSNGYAIRWYGGRPPRRKCQRLHRLIIGLEHADERQADHLNRDRLDNRRANLRIVDGEAQNLQNVPSRGGTSRHRGVSWDTSRGRWLVQAGLRGKHYFIGYFHDEQQAADAAAAWRAEHMPFSTN